MFCNSDLLAPADTANGPRRRGAIRREERSYVRWCGDLSRKLCAEFSNPINSASSRVRDRREKTYSLRKSPIYWRDAPKSWGPPMPVIERVVKDRHRTPRRPHALNHDSTLLPRHKRDENPIWLAACMMILWLPFSQSKRRYKQCYLPTPLCQPILRHAFQLGNTCDAGGPIRTVHAESPAHKLNTVHGATT
jgi:hypothetical protein